MSDAEMPVHRNWRKFITRSSGPTFEIRHPEMALLTRTSILIGTDLAEDGVPAEFKIVSLLHVTSIEPMTSQAA